MNKLSSFVLLLFIATNIYACNEDKPMKTVESLDLKRFMGDWYVIAIMPNFIEKNAVNGIESYTLSEKGHVEIKYTFRKNNPDGKLKSMTGKGFIHNKQTKAEWRVQFVWPVRFAYLVIDLAEDYSYTVVGVPSRKYAWIMSRTPHMRPEVYSGIVERMRAVGYDVAKLERIPQKWDVSSEADSI